MTTFAKAVIGLLVGALFLVLFALNASAQATEHCPDHQGNPGKVESGNLNDIILDEGTVFCVKGSTTATGKLTADGETSLVDYLNIDRDVSYYIIYEEPPSTTTTTTSIPETTTTVAETTTTTIVKETTTTNGEESTTTTNPQETTTSAPSSSTTNPSPTTTEAPRTSVTLPYTGIDDPLALGVLGLLLGSTGGLILAATRKGNDDEDI